MHDCANKKIGFAYKFGLTTIRTQLTRLKKYDQIL